MTALDDLTTSLDLRAWDIDDYHCCADLYASAGVDLLQWPVVGVGSVCRRQGMAVAGEIFRTLAQRDLPLHGFGVKISGLMQFGRWLTSADSMAWSYAARRQAPLEGCTTHINCANCIRYATDWYRTVAEKAASERERAQSAPEQPPLWDLHSSPEAA